ncbi:MAG TPA: hypothetical protein VFU07_09665 [Candidatus Lumbricidophila sp.]|nr:hypothetical protein [Candidatus Lumbricidophila sp.]
MSRELQTLLTALRDAPKELAKEIRKRTKPVAQEAWQEEVRGRVTTRLQTRALLGTARVAVTDSQVTMRSGGIGQLSSGVKIATIASATEFGANPSKVITSHSGKGKAYKRRLGSTFGPVRKKGNVVLGAAAETTSRIARLWIQTAVRTLHEAFKKGGAK